MSLESGKRAGVLRTPSGTCLGWLGAAVCHAEHCCAARCKVLSFSDEPVGTEIGGDGVRVDDDDVVEEARDSTLGTQWRRSVGCRGSVVGIFCASVAPTTMLILLRLQVGETLQLDKEINDF